jgi:hypothetical protein
MGREQVGRGEHLLFHLADEMTLSIRFGSHKKINWPPLEQVFCSDTRRPVKEQSMRKRVIGETEEAPVGRWLDLEHLASAEVTSEDAEYPIESALRPGDKGWRAAQAGEQIVRFHFDQPQRIRLIRLIFEENRQERTHEFSLAWSGESDPAPREIVRQQYNFNPPQNTREVEDYQVDLQEVSAIELRIRPDIRGGDVRASLGLIQVA